MNLILATRNMHKRQEIAAILGDAVRVWALPEIGFVDEIVENGATFEENARIKVSQLWNWVCSNSKFQLEPPWVLLADDSGLEVEALSGAPGVRSARYAGEVSNDRANLEKLLGTLQGLPGPQRTAQFRCVLAAIHVVSRKAVSPVIHIFEGTCRGKIGFFPKGEHGFGYDPIFFPEGFCRTFAELEETEKNAISHRAHAMKKFRQWLEQGFPTAQTPI